jgi:hypothetical protein
MGQGMKAAVWNGEHDGAMLLLSMDRCDGLWSLAWRRSMAPPHWITDRWLAGSARRLVVACMEEIDGSSSLDRGSRCSSLLDRRDSLWLLAWRRSLVAVPFKGIR